MANGHSLVCTTLQTWHKNFGFCWYENSTHSANTVQRIHLNVYQTINHNDKRMINMWDVNTWINMWVQCILLIWLNGIPKFSIFGSHSWVDKIYDLFYKAFVYILYRFVLTFRNILSIFPIDGFRWKFTMVYPITTHVKNNVDPFKHSYNAKTHIKYYYRNCGR